MHAAEGSRHSGSGDRELTDVELPSREPSKSLSAIDRAMAILIEGKRDIPEDLLKEAGPKIAERFQFQVIESQGHADGEYVALITPLGYDEEYKSAYQVVTFVCPEAKYTDDCVYGLWEFGPERDSEAKMTEYLKERGFKECEG